MTTPHELPRSARCVIIGGGVAGTSIAFHLAELGWRDVVLLDRAQLASGSTFLAAGLVEQVHPSAAMTRMAVYSVDLYRRLGGGEHDPGWTACGSLRLAGDPERWAEARRLAGWARTVGLPLELVSPREAAERFPLLDHRGLHGAAWLPTDGHLDPTRLTNALAAGARRGGCLVASGTRVWGIDVVRGRVRRVCTDRGDLIADVVVCAAGMYAAEVGRLAGVRIPVVPMAGQYVVTPPDPDPVRHGLPLLRDPDLRVFVRADADGALIAGGDARRCTPWALRDGGGLDEIPPDFNGRLLEEDRDGFAEIAAGAARRVPAVGRAGPGRLVGGPEACTPDGRPCLGETAVRGLFVAAGLNGRGLAAAGGVGRVMAEWIAEGEPPLDLWSMDVRRFGEEYRTPRHTLARTREACDGRDRVRHPHDEPAAGRPLRTSPVYDWQAAHRACFGETAGWEQARWLAVNEPAGDVTVRAHGWAGRHWSPAIEAEHRACRESAALFDRTPLGKLEVTGPGAAEFLDRLCTNRVAGEIGRVTHTLMLNRRGGIESDLTVVRLEEDRFGLVCGPTCVNHDLAWIRSHAPAGGSLDVRVDDVTSQWACFALWGPGARAVLAGCTTADLADEAFPPMTARFLDVGDVPVGAMRVGFVGEPGYELYARVEFGVALWRTLWEAGRERGLVAGGSRAVDSLRLECGHPVWGAEISPAETPFEAGLGHLVRLDKGSFVGREALQRARRAGPPASLLRCLVLDDPRAVALGREPVRIDGTVLWRVASGGYGYSTGRSFAYAHLPAELSAAAAEVHVEIEGRWVAAEVAAAPPHRGMIAEATA